MLTSCSVLHIPLLLNGIWMDYIFKLSMLKPPPVPQIQNEKRLRFFFPSISQGIVVIRLPMVGFWGQIPVLFLHVMFSNRTFLGKKPINNHWWIFFSVKSVKHCYNPSTLRSSPFKKKNGHFPPTTSTARRLERRPVIWRPWVAMVWDDWFDDLHGFGGCLYADYADEIK